MQIAYQDRPVFFSNVASPLWLPGSLDAVDGGHVVTLPTGRVLSVQPDGSFQDRDPGTAGAYEVCQIDPAINVLRFNPAGVPYAVVYRAA